MRTVSLLVAVVGVAIGVVLVPPTAAAATAVGSRDVAAAVLLVASFRSARCRRRVRVVWAGGCCC